MRVLPFLTLCIVLSLVTREVALPGTLAAQSGSFGVSVLVEDGEMLIAEPNNHFRSGLVYVYRRTGGEWIEAGRLQAPDPERADGFGTVLARTGNTLFVGQKAGPLHIFVREGGTWRATGTLDSDLVRGVDPECNQYGYCGIDFGLTLAAGGDWLFVGRPGRADDGSWSDEVPGAVHLFRRTAEGSWSAEGRLEPADGQPEDGFGASIAFADDRVLVGAPYWNAAGGSAEEAGRVVEFRLQNGAWTQTGSLQSVPEANARFGASVALTGDRAVAGAPGSADGHGAAFLFHREAEGDVWTEGSRLAAFNSIRGDLFGTAVGLVGHDVWVGAPAPRGTDIGSVYVFSGSPDEELLTASRRIRLTDTVTRDAFGDRIVASGGVVAVTATGMHHQAGAVFVYERGPGGEWTGGNMLASPPDALTALVGEERRCDESGRVGPFECEDVELLAFIPSSLLRDGHDARGVRMNDNWGWTDPDTGREYALVGRNDGTSFVDITDPTNPVLIGDLPKTPDTPPSQLWRDIKTYDYHAFIVADGAGNHGMQVFDLRRLRDVSDPPELFEPDAHYDNVASVHNIVINEDTGYAYLVGSRGGGVTCGGGLHMVNIQEPLNPRFEGCFADTETGRQGTGSTHDAQCVVYRGPDERYHGREICLGANENMLSIADVTDKQNPVALARVGYPNTGYLHQGWLTEDQRYFYMDDEADLIQGLVETTRTLIWDLSDLEDPVLATEFMGSMDASAHNLYIRENLAYQANYRYGLHILDITDPLAPEEVGYFNTAPYLSGPGFSGAWSNYPFFESGTIIITSVQEGLFVVKKRDPDVVF